MNIFDPKNNFEWRDYLKILDRRKWYFIIPFLLVLPLGVYKIVSNKPVYVSTCTIKIQPSSLHLLPNTIKQSLPKVSQPMAFGVKKEIMHQDYLNQVIDHLNLEEDPRFRLEAEKVKASFPDMSFEEAVQHYLLKMLNQSVRVENYGPDVVVVKAYARSPELAYSIVKTLCDIYINDSLRRAMSSVKNALNFNDEQIALFKKRVEEAERKLEEFKRELITNDLSEETISRDALDRIHNAIVSLEITIKDKRDYVQFIEEQFKTDNDVPLPDSPAIQKYQEKIDRQIQEMAELMKTFSWKSPEVINVNRKINDNREAIKTELQRLYKEKYPGIDVPTLNLYLERAVTQIDLSIMQRKKEAFNKLVRAFKEEKSQDPSREMLLAKLQSEVRVNRQIYNMFMQKNQGAQIEETVSEEEASDRFKILAHPRRPLQPVNASSNMILIVTLVAGMGLGGCSVYVREYLDTSIRSVNEAESLYGVPVIGVLPYLGKQTVSPQKKWTVLLIILIGLIVISSLVLVYFKFQSF